MNVINRNYKILPTFHANLFYVMFCIIALQRTTHSHETWVFGMVDTSHQPTLGYIEVVSQCDAVTLLPIIQAHVACQWNNNTFRPVGGISTSGKFARYFHSFHS